MKDSVDSEAHEIIVHEFARWLSAKAEDPYGVCLHDLPTFDDCGHIAHILLAFIDVSEFIAGFVYERWKKNNPGKARKLEREIEKTNQRLSVVVVVSMLNDCVEVIKGKLQNVRGKCGSSKSKGHGVRGKCNKSKGKN